MSCFADKMGNGGRNRTYPINKNTLDTNQTSFHVLKVNHLGDSKLLQNCKISNCHLKFNFTGSVGKIVVNFRKLRYKIVKKILNHSVYYLLITEC